MGDLNGDGEIDLGEFIHLMCPHTASRFLYSSSSVEDVLSYFKHINSNGDGAICQQEIYVGLNSYRKKFTIEEVNSMFAIAEVNSDGEINLTELVGMMFPAAAEGLAKFRREYKPLMNAKQVLDFNLEWGATTQPRKAMPSLSWEKLTRRATRFICGQNY
jgi:hypothetical protein